jgi:hypothetical protein
VSVFPQVVTRNWRLKLSAFVLSVFLWGVVTVLPRNREIMPSVPVRVDLSDPAWALAEPPTPATVTVHLGGLADVRDAFIRIPIDQVVGSDTIVRLRPDWVMLGGQSGVVVQSITPPSVALRFEPTHTKAVPLTLRTENDFPAGLALVQPLAHSPQVTTVRGPARVVETLDSVSLVPLDLSEVSESGAYRVSVDTTGLAGLSFQPTGAQIAVNLQPSAERILVDVPVVVEAPPGVDSATLLPEPATVQVTLSGAITLVDQTSASNVTAVVPALTLEGIAEGNTWSVPIRIAGVNPLLRADAGVDSVRVLRAPAPPGAGTPPDTVRRDTVGVRPPPPPRRQGSASLARPPAAPPRLPFAPSAETRP